MKRSRIFLGLTASCLAVAGIVAAKSFSPGAQQFVFTSGGQGCKAITPNCIQDNSSSLLCKTVLALHAAAVQVYTIRTAQQKWCKSPLHYTTL